MANYGRDIRNSLHNIERHEQDQPRSAAQFARSNAATTQAVRSAATGAWVGAGFQAVSAFQSARAARAAEEQLALQQAMAERQHTMAEQATWHQFSMWRQSADGIAFLAWREPACKLAQLIRDRDSMWLEGWTTAIGRAQSEIPDSEKQRVIRHPSRLKQTGLKVASVLSFVLAGLFTLSLLFQVFVASVSQRIPESSGYTYAQCQADLNAPNTLLSTSDCAALKHDPAGTIIQQVIPLGLFLGLGIMLIVVRMAKRKEARADHALGNEAQARINHWRYDPLAVTPGYAGSVTS
ncbi:hypothetical protein [Mycetocola miduiensis]|uniref:Uncharacterized protein n=1 Tax=Mycetocola miduiensis TaxID=995034 RepID=A0A1I4ZL74_9MICO|nr:hypothetical protein [Mycetocola miduiensis]SFN51005.1 hypothetical protein SAMN05216219_0900 [Mycetocola miduiensis]